MLATSIQKFVSVDPWLARLQTVDVRHRKIYFNILRRFFWINFCDIQVRKLKEDLLIAPCNFISTLVYFLTSIYKTPNVLQMPN